MSLSSFVMYQRLKETERVVQNVLNAHFTHQYTCRWHVAVSPPPPLLYFIPSQPKVVGESTNPHC